MECRNSWDEQHIFKSYCYIQSERTKWFRVSFCVRKSGIFVSMKMDYAAKITRLKERKEENRVEYLKFQEEKLKIGKEICKIIAIDYEKVTSGRWREENNPQVCWVISLNQIERLFELIWKNSAQSQKSFTRKCVKMMTI